MKPLRSMLAVFLCMLGTSVLAHAQGVGASGDISGTVTDPSGAVVPNATVTATEAEKGLKRTSLSDNRGEYHFTALPPASYEVSAQISGFQTAVYKGVIVNVGQTVVLDFHLKVSQTSEQVEVTSEPPVVETEKSHQADTINEQYIRDLPVNRRDYLTFTLLAPGVNDSTRLSADQDFRVKQTPQSGLSFYGSNGRGNSVTVDGGEANDDSGGVRLTLSQDAVQEFQINRSNYNAELGGASGASINIVSKTGTNDLHGSLYGFFRNDAMDARNPFAISQALQPGQTFNPAAPDVSGTRTKDSLSRQQTGGTVGFPVLKDKTFLFASIDGLRQDAQNAVPMLTNTTEFRPDNGGPLVKGVLVGNNQQAILSGLAAEGGTPVPCLTGQPALPAATCAAILQNILTINPATSPRNQFLVNQFENNGGLLPYNTRVYQVSARLDHQFSDRNQAYLRYSFAHDNEQSPDVQSLTGFSRGSSIQTYDSTIQAAWFHQFSARTQNELRGQWNYTNFNVIPNVPGEAGLDIAGFGNFGTQIFLPNLTIMQGEANRVHHQEKARLRVRTQDGVNGECRRENHQAPHHEDRLLRTVPGQSQRIPYVLPGPVCLRVSPRRHPQPVLASACCLRTLGISGSHQRTSVRFPGLAAVLSARFRQPNLQLPEALDRCLFAGLLGNDLQLYAELWSPVRTGLAIRPIKYR